MATPRPTVVGFPEADKWAMVRLAAFPRFRVLTGDGDVIYASQAYTLLRAKITAACVERETVGCIRPTCSRHLTVTWRLCTSPVRADFRALAELPSGHSV